MKQEPMVQKIVPQVKTGMQYKQNLLGNKLPDKKYDDNKAGGNIN